MVFIFLIQYMMKGKQRKLKLPFYCKLSPNAIVSPSTKNQIKLLKFSKETFRRKQKKRNFMLIFYRKNLKKSKKRVLQNMISHFREIRFCKHR